MNVLKRIWSGLKVLVDGREIWLLLAAIFATGGITLHTEIFKEIALFVAAGSLGGFFVGIALYWDMRRKECKIVASAFDGVATEVADNLPDPTKFFLINTKSLIEEICNERTNVAKTLIRSETSRAELDVASRAKQRDLYTKWRDSWAQKEEHANRSPWLQM